MSPTLWRMLLTIAAVPVGAVLGLALAIVAVGAPHAAPGFLMDAPEPVRNTVGMVVAYSTPVVLIYLIWHGPIWRAISNWRRSI